MPRNTLMCLAAAVLFFLGSAFAHAQIYKFYSLNERGERVYLEDKDRPQALENAKQIVARDCPG